MQVSTGQVYRSFVTAVAAGVPSDDLVQVTGTEQQIASLSAAVRRTHDERQRARTRRAQQKQSRRVNRR